jgi:hypothetical protein
MKIPGPLSNSFPTYSGLIHKRIPRSMIGKAIIPGRGMDLESEGQWPDVLPRAYSVPSTNGPAVHAADHQGMLNTMRSRILPAIGLAVLLSAGCADSGRDETVREEAAAAAAAWREAMSELRDDVRSTIDDVGDEIEQLDERYMSAGDEVAETWSESRASMQEYRQGLEADLARLETATADEAQQLKREMADDLEQLTERVERARLESVESGDDFVSASRDRMGQVERDIQTFADEAASLSAEGRANASESMEGLRERAGDLDDKIERLVDATADEIDEKRGDIAQELSSLTASVRRELFEIRQAVTE